MSVFTNLLLCTFLFLATIDFIFCNNAAASNVSCIESERRALLSFKQDLVDNPDQLTSWVDDEDGGNCCQWAGVVCNISTQHITELHLQFPYYGIYDFDFDSTDEYEAHKRLQLRGTINPSLLNLQNLIHLNLSGNNFGGSQIPNFLGSMRSLRRLDLSYAGFIGKVPPELGNLTNIHYLSLGGEFTRDQLYSENLHWLSNLSLLQHLDLSYVTLIDALDWLQVVSTLPSLVELRLSGCELRHINPSLLNLQHLIHLDLSENDFGGSQIPNFLGSMWSLRRLDLSYAGFTGKVPPELGNLTNIHYLRLGGGDQLYSENLHWLSNLSLLQHLDLSYITLTDALDWLQVVSTFPSLVELYLSGCQLRHIPQLTYVHNLSSLAVLDLSSNHFDNSLIPCIFSLRNLFSINLGENNFQGSIPIGLQNMSHLRKLYLYDNSFNSSIPYWFYSFGSRLEFLSLSGNDLQGRISSAIRNLTSLVYLDISYNAFEVVQWETINSIGRLCNLRFLELGGIKLNQNVSDIFRALSSSCVSNRLWELSLESTGIFGELTNVNLRHFKGLVWLDLADNLISGAIPASFGELQSLEWAIFENNSMVGVVSEVHFAKLMRLKYFLANGNSLELKVNPSWIPSFQILYLELRSWRLGPQFPLWLRSQTSLKDLDLSNSSMACIIPHWFWNLSSTLRQLDLSNNQITGEIPSMGANKIGKNSYIRTLGATINLSSNKFKGQVPKFYSKLRALDLSNNQFSGSIVHFLCDNGSIDIELLNLGENFLAGEMTDCWTSWKKLAILRLDNNNFFGSIPSSIGELNHLQALHLRNNSLSGEIPLSLKSCKSLVSIDLAENQLEGAIPTWISYMPNLTILNLHSNKFYNKIPEEICELATLHILDFSHNNLSGSIPRCIDNFNAMVNPNDSGGNAMLYDIHEVFQERALLVMKGKIMEYNTTLKLVRSLDFSSNSFSGEIPKELTTLIGLRSLNLSHNLLIGRIPQEIGAMKLIESLDLSMNQLSGEIPQSISSLNFLSYLNLSSNNLRGRIPSSTQLQSLDASSFIGNELCGLPLNVSCSESFIEQNYHDEQGKIKWFYVSMAFGFVVGFWSVVGPLLYNRQFRVTYFHFLDRLGDKIRFYCKL